MGARRPFSEPARGANGSNGAPNHADPDGCGWATSGKPAKGDANTGTCGVAVQDAPPVGGARCGGHMILAGAAAWASSI